MLPKQDESKIKMFFDYNKENIYMNLIQAEDHAKYASDLDHVQCIIKHLMFVLAELKEMQNHARIVRPEVIDDIVKLRDKVYNLYKEIASKQVNVKELPYQIWALRKEFEKIFDEFNTNKCESIVCSIKEVKKMGKLKKLTEELDDVLQDIEGDILGLGQLVHLCWKKAHEKLGEKASPVEKFKFVWNCIREGDPVTPDILERMKEEGWTPKPAPMCVISKMVKENLPREKAEKECIEEGKLHPINVYAFLAREKEE